MKAGQVRAAGSGGPVPWRAAFGRLGWRRRSARLVGRRLAAAGWPRGRRPGGRVAWGRERRPRLCPAGRYAGRAGTRDQRPGRRADSGDRAPGARHPQPAPGGRGQTAGPDTDGRCSLLAAAAGRRPARRLVGDTPDPVHRWCIGGCAEAGRGPGACRAGPRRQSCFPFSRARGGPERCRSGPPRGVLLFGLPVTAGDSNPHRPATCGAGRGTGCAPAGGAQLPSGSVAASVRHAWRLVRRTRRRRAVLPPSALTSSR
jgi:hypothetical protein